MKYYSIDEKRLLDLLESEHILNALESAGVDNWPWYYEARTLYTDGQDISYEEMAEESLKNEFEYKEIDGKF